MRMKGICELKTMDNTKNFKSKASENRASESKGFFYVLKYFQNIDT